MRLSDKLCLGVMLAALLSPCRLFAATNEVPFDSSWESLRRYQCPEWFRDAKLGIFLHWGLHSVQGVDCWYARQMYIEGSSTYQYHIKTYGHPSKFGFKDFIPMWKAEKFDADELVRVFKEAGAKYVVPVAAYCDNFDAWNSKHHRWNTVNMGPKKDLIGLWRKATKKQGLRLGVSTHVERSWSWLQVSHGADKQGDLKGVPYDGADPKYADFYLPAHGDTSMTLPSNAPPQWRNEWMARIKDLCEQHHPDLLYFDGGMPFPNDDGLAGREVAAWYYNQNAKWHEGKLEAVLNTKKHRSGHGPFDAKTCVRDMERGLLEDIQPDPWQNDTTVSTNKSWFYRPNCSPRPLNAVVDMLVDIVSKNGNLLLNFALKPDGTLEEPYRQFLKGLGEWMKVNGEAIYATRPWTTFGEGPTAVKGGHMGDDKLGLTKEDIRFTRSKDGNTIYAILMDWPGDGAKVTIKAMGQGLSGTKIQSVTMLGSDARLVWAHDERNGLTVTVPEKKPCEHAFSVKIVLELALPAGIKDMNPKLTPVEVKATDVTGKFWSPKLKVYSEETIPHSWGYVNGSIQELKNSATADKQPSGQKLWAEANLHKVLESASYALALHPNPELDRKIDEIVAIIAAGQQPDGFAHAWVINRSRAAKPSAPKPSDAKPSEPKKPWDNLYLQHDGYVSGHLYEAAVAHFRVTGKRSFLEVACKSADQAWRHFIEQKNPGFCGHAEMELALVELYRVTGNKKYLDLAQAFIERRGLNPQLKAPYPPVYFQDDLPVRQQKDMGGHAVRAVFFATGVADVALETGDREMHAAADRLWQSASKRKMYITGSVGSTGHHEAFGSDYHLPDKGYCESCAACGMVNFAHRMFRLEGNAADVDELERVLYNGVLHGISLEGKSFYYGNPLSGNHQRGNNWTCCPPTLSRTLLQVGRYCYAYTDRDIYMNLYVGGTCTVPLSKTAVDLRVETDYPWDGAVNIVVRPKKDADFSICLRIPGWCRDAKIKVNDKAIADLQTRKGYAVLTRRWKDGDTVRLDLPMPVMRMEANPKVNTCIGKVAIQRGPLVYALEGIDNDSNPDITLPADPKFGHEYRADFLGGLAVVTGTTADGKPFTAIPFYALANRAPSQHEVWMVQSNKTENASGWEDQLYREYRVSR